MELPASAAWRHVEARDGFELLFPRAERSGGIVLAGHSCAVEEGVAWAVRYRIVVGPGWLTRSAYVTGWSEAGRSEVRRAPAYVRAPGLEVERLAQSYARLEDDGPRRRYDYAAARFDFFAVLVYDESGLVLDYPGLAVRVA